MNDTPDRGGRAPFLSPMVRLVIAAVFAVLLVASAIVGVMSYNEVQAAEARADDRRAAVQAAEQFTVQVNNYDAKTVDDYEDAVGDLLTTKFRGEFEKAMKDIVVSVKDAEMDSKGEVLASGVASADQDSAQVLVVADAAVKTVFDERNRHFRWEIALAKVDGEWLVDDFTPVA